MRIRFRRQLAVHSDKLAFTQGEREKVKAKADKVSTDPHLSFPSHILAYSTTG